MTRLWLTTAMILGLSACATPMRAPAHRYRFAVIGDTPYTDREREHFPRLMDRIGREELVFVAHIGDIKSDAAPCNDDVLLDRYRLFQESRHPFVYVPGDNEWTDCSSGYDPVESLQRIREIFFRDDETLGQRRLRLERQSTNAAFRPYRENVRWRIGRVLFVGLNVVGSENNFGAGPDPSREFVERRRANQAWLAEAFALAASERMAGVVILSRPTRISRRPTGEAERPDTPSSWDSFAQRSWRSRGGCYWCMGIPTAIISTNRCSTLGPRLRFPASSAWRATALRTWAL